jgi:hypothetical protein
MKSEIYRYKMFVQCAFQLETWMTTVLQSCQYQHANSAICSDHGYYRNAIIE